MWITSIEKIINFFLLHDILKDLIIDIFYYLYKNIIIKRQCRPTLPFYNYLMTLKNYNKFEYFIKSIAGFLS
mgnify:CR=1 FL=1